MFSVIAVCATSCRLLTIDFKVTEMKSLTVGEPHFLSNFTFIFPNTSLIPNFLNSSLTYQRQGFA